MSATAPWHKHLEMDVPAPSKMSLCTAPIVSLTVKMGILHRPECQSHEMTVDKGQGKLVNLGGAPFFGQL